MSFKDKYSFAEFLIKKGATLPAFMVKVGKDGDGFVTDPTGATVKFTMSLRTDPTAIKVNAAAAVIQSVSLNSDGTYYAELVYQWVSGDTDTVNEYDGEFEVTIGADKIYIPAGDPQTDGSLKNKFFPIEVHDRLAA